MQVSRQFARKKLLELTSRVSYLSDAGVNGAVEYFLVEGSHNLTDNDGKVADGFGTFAIAYPHQGHVS